MSSLMETKYDSPALQAAVQVELKLIQITYFISYNYIHSLPKGITTIVDHIIVLSTQDPLPFCDEWNKIRHLRLAVLSFTWSQ